MFGNVRFFLNIEMFDVRLFAKVQMSRSSMFECSLIFKCSDVGIFICSVEFECSDVQCSNVLEFFS